MSCRARWGQTNHSSKYCENIYGFETMSSELVIVFRSVFGSKLVFVFMFWIGNFFSLCVGALVLCSCLLDKMTRVFGYL